MSEAGASPVTGDPAMADVAYALLLVAAFVVLMSVLRGLERL